MFRWLGWASFAAMGAYVLIFIDDAPSLRGSFDVAEAQIKRVTELKVDPRGHFITDAEIDGTSIKALVDTGATAVALSYEDADRIGLKPFVLKFDVPVATANGIAQAARVTLRRVEVDGVMVRDVEGLVLPEGMMEGTLLGMSFLSRLRSFKVEDGVLYLQN